MRRLWPLLSLALISIFMLSACDLEIEENSSSSRGIDISNFSMPARPANLETARVDFVIDGDTIDLQDGTRVRLIGINTPEREQPYYAEATQFLKDRVEGKTIGLEFDVEITDQFDRTLAYIWLDDSLINAELLLNGYADTYFIPPNTKYEALFDSAEQSAKTTNLNIWKKGSGGLEIRTIFYNAPGPDDENPNGEWIEIQNIGGADLNLNNYTLQDSSSSNLYTFRNFTLDAGDIVTIYSGCGTDTSNDLYWCNDGSIWNNGGDSAMLRDNNGDFVDDYTYTGN